LEDTDKLPAIDRIDKLITIDIMDISAMDIGEELLGKYGI